MAPCFQYFIYFLPKIVLFTLLLLTCTQSLFITHDDECLALYLFKQTFPNPSFEAPPGFPTFDSWKITNNASDDGSDCCLWDGVVCSNEEEDGHVIGLDLSERFLHGHINSSSSLFNLVHLQTLNLATNDFTGSRIPYQISRLKQLRSLNLSESGFSGQIPNEISHLIQLSSLDLSWNPLKLQSPSLEKLVQNLSGLEELDLSGVDISSSLPRFLANFSSLRSIKLENCFLQNEFPVAILQLPRLKFLDVAFNTNLTGFLPEFHNNSLLEYLSLYSTGFSGIIPKSIENLNRLIHLDLDGCSFSGIIPGSLANMTQLTYLDLSQNEFTGVVPSLESLAELTVLDLDGCSFSGIIPGSLANMTQLTYLDLSQNEFTGVVPSLASLAELTVLDLDGCSFSGIIPGSLANMTQLTYLDLSQNEFTGVVPSLASLAELTVLDLDGCSFSGIIPGSLANMTQLTYLDLSQNEFTGVVPSLASLAELTVLDLSGNSFEEGGLPDWLGKLTNLTTLILARMNLYGEIPPFLTNLTKLSRVGMEQNSLVGRIPSSFMNLTQLSMIDLGLNQLQGPISSSFSNFKSLQDLSLNNNNFSGKVELDWFLELDKLEALWIGGNRISFVANTKNYTNGTLPELDTLDLSSCNLKEYPTFLRFQHKLKFLILAHNNIQGLIPEWGWINSQETLELIDLSNNFITGFHQSHYFLRLVRLKIFIIANNMLHGRLPIPPRTIEVYDVSNNHLEGEIPPLICELKSLRVLVLSSNNITGILPPCFGSLSNSLFALDLGANNLQGTMMNSFTQDNPLKVIALNRNQFVGHVSKSLINCTHLEILVLGDNFFDDVFPFWLGNLIELQVLILRSNKFFGELQQLTTASSQFPKLRIIDLSNNGFSGQFPHKYFQSWNAMKLVRVGQPSSMDTMIKVQDFEMVISYAITITYKSSEQQFNQILNLLVAIDLSCNKFEGEIPRSLQNLHGLQSLNLSNNHFTGHVLSSLGNLKNLESLDLSRNKLSGEIPQQLLQLDFLAILNLSFNHLDGRIPQGPHFDTFDNNSYLGNHGLCGKPLSKECQNSKVSTPPQTRNISESFLPSERVDWIVILCGVGSGLVIGIVFGNFLYARYSDWFIERFGMKKDKWVTPLSNRRRNQAL